MTVVGGEAIEIADHHADGTDVNRRAAGGGGGCRKIRYVHALLYGRSAQRHNRAKANSEG